MRGVWVNGDDGKELSLVSFSYRTRVGFEPSEGEMVLVGEVFDELSRSGSVKLFPSAGDTFSSGLTLADLYITSFERMESDDGGALFRVKVADRRIFWRFGTVSMNVNEPTARGGYAVSSLDGGLLWTFRRLVELLFSFLGEAPDLSSLPENPFPLIGMRWVGERVVSLLGALLGLAGFTVSLDFSGRLNLVRVGESRTVVDDTDYTDEWHERLILNRPDVVEFIGSPIMCWKRVSLEPQGVDTDGRVKDLESLSYLVGKDIGLEIACDFASLSEREREMARASVGRLFRVRDGSLPVFERDYDGRRARLTASIFVADKKRGFKNLESVEVPFRILDAEEGLIITDAVCGTLTEEEIDLLPSVVDGEPVRVNLSEVVFEFPTVKRDSTGREVRWRRSFGSGAGKVVFDFAAASVVEGSAKERFYETVAERIASSILSVPSDVDMVRRRFVGPRDIPLDGVVQSVSLRLEDGLCYTETESCPIPFDFAEVQNRFSLLFLREGNALLRSSASPQRRLQNANKAGVVPLVSDAEEEPPTETRIGGRLKSFDEENALPEVDRVVPFERFNFAYREQRTGSLEGEEPQDKVWAVRLITDDKHKIESELNRSTLVVRLCDENEGDLDDIWRVRAVPSPSDTAAGTAQAGSPTYLPVVSSNLSYRVMWLINTAIGAEGGWMTDVPPDGLGKMVRDCPKQVAPPRHIGQVGNIVVLTDDDLICTTSDGDAFVLANLRHDAHFHLDRDHDGRIRFTTTPPGMRPTDGWTVIGEMVCDPSLANDNTELQLESGQWCPQIRINSSVTPIYPLGVTLLVEENPAVSLPLSGLTNAEFDGLSVAEAKKKNADLENRIVEVINAIFTADME